MHVNRSLIGKKMIGYGCVTSQLASDWSLVLGCMRNKSLSGTCRTNVVFSVSTFVCLWLPLVVAVDWMWFALLSVPSDIVL